MVDEDTKKILEKFENKLKEKIDVEDALPSNEAISKEYVTFREESMGAPESAYEKLCNFSERIIKVRPKEKDRFELETAIDLAHLNLTPMGANSFAVLLALFIIFLGVMYTIIKLLFAKTISIEGVPIFVLFVSLLSAAIVVKPISRLPILFANRWRLKASNQMVLAMLYVVMYMRHTPNLERALKFSAEHITGILSLDLKKVFWDIETSKCSSLKESLDHYLQKWIKTNPEFVESFHLIESSLYEPCEERRLQLLDKSLEVILEGTYEGMLHYAHDLRNPITMLHMLGVVLPILGLVMFPLVGSFLQGLIKWYHLAILYNIVLPIVIYYVGMELLSRRPTGYGESESVKQWTDLDLGLLFLSIFIGGIIVLIGLSPLIIHVIEPNYDLNLGANFGRFLDYKDGNGPYGVGAMLVSFLVPLGIALGISLYYITRTKESVQIRNNTKTLENEFVSGLFQLGNRVGEGIPSELAFEKVAQVMSGTRTGDLFSKITINLRKLGLSLKEAIFNPQVGAIVGYPSSLVESTMKILVESSRKGPKVVSQSLVSISAYVNNIHKVNERLKDLLAEVISSMKSQISFMAPLIAGIVVGIASMVTVIISKLGDLFTQIGSAGEDVPINLANIVNIFNIKEVIPLYHFQIVVGLYVLQVAIILTILANGVENGTDKLNEKYLIGKNVRRSVFLYTLIAAVTTFIFTLLAGGILMFTQAS